MKRCELKEGMIIQDTNGVFWRILYVDGNKRLIPLNNGYVVNTGIATRYNEDLSGKDNYAGIHQIFDESGDSVLWEAKPIEMTISEIESKLKLPAGSLRIKK